MEYNSLIQSVIRKMPSTPFVLCTYMIDAGKELAIKEAYDKNYTTSYPMVILDKSYGEVLPQDTVSEVWLKDVSIYIITDSNVSKGITELIDLEYETREKDIFESVLYPFKDELIETMISSYKFNFSNKGNQTVTPYTVKRYPYILSSDVSQNNLNKIVDCLEVHFDYLKIIKQ